MREEAAGSCASTHDPASTSKVKAAGGPVGSGLLMKTAVDLYLDTMLVGLAEAVHLADRNGLDLGTFQAAIAAGPMASDVTRVEIPELVTRDFPVQAATSDAYADAA